MFADVLLITADVLLITASHVQYLPCFCQIVGYIFMRFRSINKVILKSHK